MEECKASTVVDVVVAQKSHLTFVSSPVRNAVKPISFGSWEFG